MAGNWGQLTPGVATAVNGRLAGNDHEDWYRVPVGMLATPHIELTGVTADLDLELQDRVGDVIGWSANSNPDNDLIRLILLPFSDYFIKVSRYSAAGSICRLSTRVGTANSVTPTATSVTVGVDVELNSTCQR